MKTSLIINKIKGGGRRVLKPIVISPPKLDKCVIISNNCIGGLLYNDYGMRFDSPTVNLQFSANDFLKFAANIDYYLQHDITEVKNLSKEFYRGFDRENDPFPVGRIDDVNVYFQHYVTFEEAVWAWQRRKERYYESVKAGYVVNLIFLLKECQQDILEEFEKLPQQHKIMLTESAITGPNVFNFDLRKAGEAWYAYEKGISLKKTYEQFDFANWLKGKE